eukprot:scaffold11349_cov236-Isochrysis_galbana.AAC.1
MAAGDVEEAGNAGGGRRCGGGVFVGGGDGVGVVWDGRDEARRVGVVFAIFIILGGEGLVDEGGTGVGAKVLEEGVGGEGVKVAG